MTAKQFMIYVERLGLSIRDMAPVLGIGEKQAYRYANNRSPVSEPVAKLLRLIVDRKIPPGEVK